MAYTPFAKLAGNQSFRAAGLGPGSPGTRTTENGVKVSYDAAADALTLTTPDGTVSDTFSDCCADTVGLDNVRLLKQGPNNRIEASLQEFLRYVGGLELQYARDGTWTHYTYASNSATVPTSIFTERGFYGLSTIPSDIPLSGTAAYNTGVTGTVTAGGKRYTLGLGGSAASFSANFATGQITTHLGLAGQETRVDPVTGLDIPTARQNIVTFEALDGTGTLSSGSPSFSGTLSNSTSTGTFAGAFFGPQASEFGYAFRSTGSAYTSTGSVAGRAIASGATAGYNSTLTNLTKSVDGFATVSQANYYTQDANGKLVNMFYDRRFENSATRLTFAYDASTNSYTFRNPPNSEIILNFESHLLPFGPANIASSQPLPQFTRYLRATAVASSTLDLYKPGATNPEIALTYVGLGHLTSVLNDNSVFESWFSYALPLSGGALTQLPTTGTATYNGVLYGLAYQINAVGGANRPMADVKGTSRFDVDFGAWSAKGTLSPILTFRGSGTVETLSPVVFNVGSITLGSNAVSGISVPTDYSNVFQVSNGSGRPVYGAFVGPNAEELSAQFSFAVTTSVGPTAISGATIAKRGP